MGIRRQYLGLALAHDLESSVIDDRPRAGRPLIDHQEMVALHRSSPSSHGPGWVEMSRQLTTHATLGRGAGEFSYDGSSGTLSTGKAVHDHEHRRHRARLHRGHRRALDRAARDHHGHSPRSTEARAGTYGAD